MKHNSISTFAQRIAALFAFAWFMIPAGASATNTGNISNAVIQGALWGSMSINWVNYSSASTKVTDQTPVQSQSQDVAMEAEQEDGAESYEHSVTASDVSK